MSEHFDGKEAVQHVIEMRAKGVVETAEVHGTEIPGHISAGADAAREVAVILAIVTLLFSPLPWVMIPLSIALIAWKGGRSAWLGWSRLERLHRVIDQERFEIEHHRSQEREELAALYAAKGFEGKLLNQVVDVLMSDGDRLLRVMLEEELGLSLEMYDHPLKQALGAATGALAASLVCVGLAFAFPYWGTLLGSFVVLAASGLIASRFERNRPMPALIWSIALGGLTMGVVYSISQLMERL